MVAEAILDTDENERHIKTTVALSGGTLGQLPNGLAAYADGLKQADINDKVNWRTHGRVWVPKTTGISMLDGGRAFMNFATRKGTFKRAANSRDFYLGAVVGDYASTDTQMLVDLNVEPRYTLDLARDAFTTVTVGTVAAGGFDRPRRLGGTNKLLVSATNEAQKVDAFSNDSFATGAKAIIEARINVISVGAGGAPDLNVGIADATHATDADSITRHLFVHMDGNATAIKFQSKDGTNTTNATDSTLTLTAGTPFEVWFDMRDPSNVKIYVDGVRVLDGTTGAATTINVSASATAWKLAVHLEKTSATDTFEVDIDHLRARPQALVAA